MVKKEKLTLMFKDDEVLTFLVIYGKFLKVEIVEELAHFDKAPYGVATATDKKERNRLLFKFFNSRTIADPRWDCKDILKATGCKNAFELSFKGHGLSLTNHYWFKRKGENLKYDDINFFTNKWDDSFARAVLSRDYKALKKADLNNPDIVTPGWAVKGWLCEEDGPRLYKEGIHKDEPEECLGEVLASSLANKLLNEGEALVYELKEMNGRYYSVSKCMLNVDEELVPLSSILPYDLYMLYSAKNRDHKNGDLFFEKVGEYGLPGLYEFFVKISCIRSLCFVNDLHFENISVIRNMKTGEIRPAPIYDLAGSFGTGQKGRQILSNINTGTFLIVYYVYGGLDPNWDYSWYDKNRLVGFENEIRRTLSLSKFFTESLLNNIIDVFRHQKEILDDLASNNK